MAEIAQTKRCSRCEQTLPASSFHLRKANGKTYLRTYCIPCERAYHRADAARKRQDPAYVARGRANMKRLQADPAWRERAQLAATARRYGLDIETARRMRAQSACDLCLREDVTTVIDHNHVTGGVRGVLCTRCNTGLGKFLDGVDLLKKAIAYLEDRDG